MIQKWSENTGNPVIPKLALVNYDRIAARSHTNLSLVKISEMLLKSCTKLNLTVKQRLHETFHI